MEGTNPGPESIGRTGARHLNTHNVYVVAGEATEQQLIASTNVFKSQLCKMFPDKKYENCEIITNLVCDKDGNSYRHAYLWVSNPEVYYILCGYNPDGSERVEIKEESENESTELDENDIDLENIDWNDILTDTVNQESKVKIKVQLKPILSLPPYEYTPEQYERVKETFKVQASDKGEPFDESVVPKYGFFEASRARAGNLDNGQVGNVLRSIVPKWLTEDKIKKEFDKFSTDKTMVLVKGKDGKGKEAQLYPKVTYSPNIYKDKSSGKVIEDLTKNVVLVEFSSTRNDGLFACQMIRKYKFKNETTGAEETTIWNFLKKFDNGHEQKSHSPDKKTHTSGGGSKNIFNRSSQEDDGFTPVGKKRR